MIDSPPTAGAPVDAHPSAEQLIAYGRGQCDDHQEHVISNHIIDCESCCRILESVPDDPLLKRLGERGREQDTDPDGHRLGPRTDIDRSSTRGPNEDERFDQLLRDHPKYQMIRRLGEGGMGVVYLARHRIMDRVIALKVISPRIIRHIDAKSRFQREVQIVAKLNHPNIVAAFDADQIGDHLCLVSEYFESESLDQIIAKGPVKVSTACDIVRRAAEGLSHAHANGLIHRDVKPQNILVSADGQVKVVDFGLASYAESDHPDQQGLTSVGVIVGTPDFMSPEQVRESTVDHRADIYSLGCTLYHLLAGRPPFAGCTRVEKLAHHLQSTPPGLMSVRSDVSPALDACVSKMMAKDPNQRYQSAADVVVALTRFGSEGSVLQVPLITQERRSGVAKRNTKRNPSTTNRNGIHKWLIGAAALLLLAAMGFIAAKGWPDPTDRSRETVELLRSRNWNVLAVIPSDPFPRDRALLYQAIDELALNCDVTSAALVPTVEGVHKIIPLADADPRQYDAVIFFGTGQIDQNDLYQSAGRHEVQRIVQSLESDGRVYGAFGTGVWTLASLDLLRGKRVANCIHSPDHFKRQSGADWIADQTLIVDGNLVTGTNTTNAVPFLTTLLKGTLGPSS